MDRSTLVYIYIYILIEAGTARVSLRAGWERMLCEGKGSIGDGFFDYSAGVPRDGEWRKLASLPATT